MTVEAMARMVEARDRHTAGHAERVQQVAIELGRLAGMTQPELRLLERAALLHDIGKVGVPDAVLNKPGPLDAVERHLMEQHPAIGREILAGTADPEMAAIVAGVSWHHERPDGHGYPDRLPGADIPLVARIIAVADVFDALVSDRPYRSGLSLGRVLEILREARGRQLDPALVDLFLTHGIWRAVYPELTGAIRAAL